MTNTNSTCRLGFFPTAKDIMYYKFSCCSRIKLHKMLLITLSIFVIPILTFGYLKYYQSRKKLLITNGHQAQLILKSSAYSRCKPNRWLVDTLSIVNPFTIDSETLLKGFKAEVKDNLAHWCGNEQIYHELVLTIRNRIAYRLSVLMSSNSTICLFQLVKQATLDAFLTGILHVHANEDLLTELPQLIIHLWANRDDQNARNRVRELIAANRHAFGQSVFWQHIEQVLSNHSNIISQIATNDFDEKIANPLNIIVPGWETMWRVVFYSLLELLRRRELLQELRVQLNQCEQQSYRKCLLLQWILKEILRLYPPTKNIYRSDRTTGQDVQISVKQIHYDKNVWGSDARSFRPNRFKDKLTDEQNHSYLPFSISCPARHGFAYAFAGAIVAEILQHCPTFSLADQSNSLQTDQLLDMARDSYKDLLIHV